MENEDTSNKMLVPLIVVLVAAAAVGGYLYIANKPAEQVAVTTVTEQPVSQATESTEAMMEGTKENDSMTTPATVEVTVTAVNFSFDVKEIKVKKGDKVRVTVKNADGFHDWKLDDFSASTKQLATGQQETVEFTADKVGTFEYYCSVGQHRAMGMVGKFIVE